MTDHTINLAIQILPMATEVNKAYAAIDEAIKIVDKSGLKYKVCPFETVIEGKYSEVMPLVDEMQAVVFDNNIDHIIVNIKLQRKANEDVYIEDKIEKYS